MSQIIPAVSLDRAGKYSSPDTQHHQALLAIREHIFHIAQTNPQKASLLSHRVAVCNWTSRDIAQLHALGLPVQGLQAEPGLLGGVGEELVIETLKGSICFLKDGNLHEVNREGKAQSVSAKIELPDGSLVEGVHRGERTLSDPEYGCLCFCPKYALLASGPGEFIADRITYRGNFFQNLFHDNTGEAVYCIAHDLRYTGGFEYGKRSGAGRLERYNCETGEFFLYYQGTWINDTLDTGTYRTPQGEQISIERGYIISTGGIETSIQKSFQAGEFAEAAKQFNRLRQLRGIDRRTVERLLNQAERDIEQQLQEWATQLKDHCYCGQFLQAQAALHRLEGALEVLGHLDLKLQRHISLPDLRRYYQSCQQHAQEQAALEAKIKELEAQKQQRVEMVPTVQQLPSIAFGAAEWAKYFGNVGAEPPLPLDIEYILESPCPFWPQRTVQETHLLVLVPKDVDGRPLTLAALGELIQHPRQGHKTKYEAFNLGQNQDVPPPQAHWVLMTRDVIPRSRDADDIQTLVSRCGPYEIPHVLDAAVCVLMEHVRTGTRFYSDCPETYTSCQEWDNKGWSLGVGCFGRAGLRVCSFHVPYKYSGVGAVRKFS